MILRCWNYNIWKKCMILVVWLWFSTTVWNYNFCSSSVLLYWMNPPGKIWWSDVDKQKNSRKKSLKCQKGEVCNLWSKMNLHFWNDLKLELVIKNLHPSKIRYGGWTLCKLIFCVGDVKEWPVSPVQVPTRFFMCHYFHG